MIELKEGTKVVTPSGEDVGKVNRFVLDPTTNEITHIVVEKGWLLPEDKVVPFELVRSATDEKLVLNEEVGDFDQLPPFEETHFIRTMDADVRRAGDPAYASAPGYLWYPPHGYVGYPGYGLGYYAWPPTETRRNIPADTVPLQEGTDVISSDGEHVGDVERLLVEPESNQTTHLVISQGLLFKHRKLVPAQWVKSAAEDKVHLAVSSKLLESLPAYEA